MVWDVFTFNGPLMIIGICYHHNQFITNLIFIIKLPLHLCLTLNFTIYKISLYMAILFFLNINLNIKILLVLKAFTTKNQSSFKVFNQKL